MNTLSPHHRRTPAPTPEPGLQGCHTVITLTAEESDRCLDICRLHHLVRTTAGTSSRTPHLLYTALRQPAEASPKEAPRDATRPEKVLIQSLKAPDLRSLIDKGRIVHADMHPFTRTFRPGDTLLLHVTASPQLRIRSNHHVPLNRAEALAWFDRRLTEHGLRAYPGSMTAGPAQQLNGTTSTSAITLPARAFTARVEVHDPDPAHQLFRNGIGPGKRFGCGLILDDTTQLPFSPAILTPRH